MHIKICVKKNKILSWANPRVDPYDTFNVDSGTSPRDKEVWSVGQGRWRPK